MNFYFIFYVTQQQYIPVSNDSASTWINFRNGILKSKEVRTLYCNVVMEKNGHQQAFRAPRPTFYQSYLLSNHFFDGILIGYFLLPYSIRPLLPSFFRNSKSFIIMDRLFLPYSAPLLNAPS